MGKKKRLKTHNLPQIGSKEVRGKRRSSSGAGIFQAAPEKLRPHWVDKLLEYKTGFLLILLLAFIPRFIHFLEVLDTPFFKRLHADPAMYHSWAIRIIDGDWLSRTDPVFYLGPLYPYFLSVIYSIAGPSTVAAVVVQVLLSTISAALIYHIGYRLFGPVAGLAAGIMAAFYLMLIFYSSLILGATMIIFVNLLMLVTLISGMEKSAWWKWALAGFFMGLSACARGNILLYAPFAAFAVALYFGIKEWRKWVPAVFLMASFALIAIMPVTLHNLLVGDDFVLLTANGGANFFIGNNNSSDGIYMNEATYKGRPMGLNVHDQKANFPVVAKQELGLSEIKPSQISSFWAKKTLESIGADIGAWVKLIGSKAKYYFNSYEVPNNRNVYFSKQFSRTLQLPLMTFGLVLPLSLLGMFILRKSIKSHAALLLFFAAHCIALLMFFVNARYRLIVVPVLLIYAGAAVAWLIEKIRAWDYVRLVSAGAAMVMVFSFVSWPVPHFSLRANYTNLANAYNQLGDQESALRYYDKAILYKGYYYAWYMKGQLLAQMNRNAAAVEVFKQGLSLAQRAHDQVYVKRIKRQLRQLQTKMGQVQNPGS